MDVLLGHMPVCLFYVRNQITSPPGRVCDTIISILSRTTIRVAYSHSYVATCMSFTSTICHAVASTLYLVPAYLTRRISVYALNPQVGPLPLEALIVFRQ